MKRRLAVAIMLAGIVSTSLAAEDYTVLRTLFIPSVYYVGDKVEMRISLRTPFANKMVAPQDIPQPGWGRIESLKIVPQEDELEIRLVFTSYQSGTRSLPSMNLGPIVLEGINIFVSSLLDSDRQSLAPPREQMLIPGTTGLLVLQIVIILLVPGVVAFALIRGRPYVKRILLRYKEGLPFRRILKSLKALASNVEYMDARSFYIRVLDETRLYLTDRLHIPAVSATTMEIEAALVARMGSYETVEALVELFKHGDLVKFANEPASLQTRMRDFEGLEQVLRIVEHLEKNRRRNPETLIVSGAGEEKADYADL